MDCSPPGSSVHGIFQARILERVVISYFRGSSRLRVRTSVTIPSALAGGFFTTELPGKPSLLEFTYFIWVCNFIQWKWEKRFKGLDLTECLMNYGRRFVTLYRNRDQDHPKEKERQKSKMADWGGLTNSCEKKRSERQGRKGKIYPSECRVPKNSKEW